MPTAHPDESLQQCCQVAGVVLLEADVDLRRITHISRQVESELANQ